MSAPSTTNVADLPGTSGNYVSIPDSAAVSITGSIDLVIKAALDDWTPAAQPLLIGKMLGIGTSVSYELIVLGDGTLYLNTSANGSTMREAISSAANGFTNGTTHWVRATRDSGTGTTTFYTSNDTTNDPAAVSWSQLGTTQATTAGAIWDSTQGLLIGSTSGSANMLAGNVYVAEVRSGIGGTVVAKFDATAVTKLGTRNPSTVANSGSAGGNWTMNGSAWDWAAV